MYLSRKLVQKYTNILVKCIIYHFYKKLRNILRRNKKDTTLRFKVGDMVQVRSAESISKTLDNDNKLDGCLFMNQMLDYCGQKFIVLKVVKCFFDEYRYKMYKTKSTLYILDKIICNGITDEFQNRCDRSCYLLWHEKWLNKV